MLGKHPQAIGAFQLSTATIRIRIVNRQTLKREAVPRLLSNSRNLELNLEESRKLAASAVRDFFEPKKAMKLT